MANHQFGLGSGRGYSRSGEPFNQVTQNATYQDHASLDSASAFSLASSSTEMQDSMSGSSAPFITWSRLYALYPVR